jgi:hypothetical protein
MFGLDQIDDHDAVLRINYAPYVGFEVRILKFRDPGSTPIETLAGYWTKPFWNPDWILLQADVGSKTTFDFSNRENARRMLKSHVRCAPAQPLCMRVRSMRLSVGHRCCACLLQRRGRAASGSSGRWHNTRTDAFQSRTELWSWAVGRAVLVRVQMNWRESTVVFFEVSSPTNRKQVWVRPSRTFHQELPKEL